VHFFYAGGSKTENALVSHVGGGVQGSCSLPNLQSIVLSCQERAELRGGHAQLSCFGGEGRR
jgi:hypothetical protein